MLRKLKKFLFFFVALLIVFILLAWVWLNIPVKSGKGADDPAVVFAKQSASTKAQYNEAYFEYVGLNLHYVEAGKKRNEAVLFLHGFPQFWYSFKHQIDTLSRTNYVIAIDGLGAGRSDAPKDISSYKLEAMAAHIKALLINLNVKKVHIVGHDWGAGMAYGFAQRYPEFAQSVVIMSAPPQQIMLDLLKNSQKQQAASAYIEKLKSANPVILKALSASRRIADNLYQPLLDNNHISAQELSIYINASKDVKRLDAHINWYRANLPEISKITDDDYWPSRNAQLSIPIMLIWGQNDKVFDPTFIDNLKKINPQMQVEKILNVGHSPQLESAEKVSNLLAGFISKN